MGSVDEEVKKRIYVLLASSQFRVPGFGKDDIHCLYAWTTMV
jgi:hypothetical protein